MLNTASSQAWDAGAEVDSALARWRSSKNDLVSKRVKPTSFSRAKLFTSMIGEQPVVFSDLQIPVEGRTGNREQALLKNIANRIPHAMRVRVHAGRAGTRSYLSSRELVARWSRGRSMFSVTDFHFRGTPLERMINLRSLSEFNLLSKGPDAVVEQEMMTFVLSSRGAFTDSHSDDPDVSNHCVTGSKLWLVWDTQEGRGAGLQDVERDEVFGVASFDLGTFCRLRSARWLVVGPGQTLFLPGRFTHRVITLERYLGFGNFFVTLPNLLQTVTRWTACPPLWLAHKSNEFVVDMIIEQAVSRLRKLSSAGSAQKDAWGAHYVPLGLRKWLRMTSLADRHLVLSRPAMGDFIHLAKSI